MEGEEAEVDESKPESVEKEQEMIVTIVPNELPEEAKATQIGAQNGQQETTEIRCPFCSQTHRVGDTLNRTELPFLVHNRQLDNLLEHEIQQEFDQKTDQQKEQLQRQQAKAKI